MFDKFNNMYYIDNILNVLVIKLGLLRG
jgi:hypothetical protein